MRCHAFIAVIVVLLTERALHGETLQFTAAALDQHTHNVLGLLLPSQPPLRRASPASPLRAISRTSCQTTAMCVDRSGCLCFIDAAAEPLCVCQFGDACNLQGQIGLISAVTKSDECAAYATGETIASRSAASHAPHR
jgi:hypothetical protein